MPNPMKVNKLNKRTSSSNRITSMEPHILFLRTMRTVVVAISFSMMTRKRNYPTSINFLSLMIISLPVASLEED